MARTLQWVAPSGGLVWSAVLMTSATRSSAARAQFIATPRSGRCHGRTVNAINPPAFADYGGAPTFSDTLVEVSAA